jgi:hypothetical protein
MRVRTALGYVLVGSLMVGTGGYGAYQEGQVIQHVVLGHLPAQKVEGHGIPVDPECPAEDSCRPDYIHGHWVIRLDPNH